MPSADGSGDSEVYQGIRVKYTMPFSGIRKTIADHMVRSLTTSAQVTILGEIDMTEMIKLRKLLVAKEDVMKTRVTYSDILIYIVSRILKNYPLINASIIGKDIKVWEDINISVAVSVEEGLIVPVIKNADKKSLIEISKDLKDVALKAKNRSLTMDEVKGGTFTISNLGSVGSGWRFDTIIINQPQSAILALGGITDRAVVRDGKVVARPIMTYMVTYDHRLLEGGSILTKFISEFTGIVENPYECFAGLID